MLPSRTRLHTIWNRSLSSTQAATKRAAHASASLQLHHTIDTHCRYYGRVPVTGPETSLPTAAVLSPTVQVPASGPASGPVPALLPQRRGFHSSSMRSSAAAAPSANQQKPAVVSPKDFSVYMERFGLTWKDNIVIAVSGGADSMALAYLLKQWQDRQIRAHRKKEQQQNSVSHSDRGATGKTIQKPSRTGGVPGAGHILAVTVDHGVRDGSREEAERVAQHLDAMGIQCKIVSIDMNDQDGNRPIDSKIQLVARDLRYKALLEECHLRSCRWLMIGHNLNDVTETFLSRVARSSGISGLASIPEIHRIHEDVFIARPLLEVPRFVLENTLRKAGFEDWVMDPTNEDERFDRNRIRHAMQHLLTDPAETNTYLKHSLYPSVHAKRRLQNKETPGAPAASDRTDSPAPIPFYDIIHTVRHMREAKDDLEAYINMRLRDLCVFVHPFGYCDVRIDLLLREQEEIQNMILLRVFAFVGSSDYLPKLKSIERITQLMKRQFLTSRTQTPKCQAIEITEGLRKPNAPTDPQQFQGERVLRVTRCLPVMDRKHPANIPVRMNIESPHTRQVVWDKRYDVRFVEPYAVQSRHKGGGPRHKAPTKQTRVAADEDYFVRLLHPQKDRSTIRTQAARTFHRIYRAERVDPKRKGVVKSSSLLDLHYLPNYLFDLNLPVIVDKYDQVVAVPHLPGLFHMNVAPDPRFPVKKAEVIVSNLPSDASEDQVEQILACHLPVAYHPASVRCVASETVSDASAAAPNHSTTTAVLSFKSWRDAESAVACLDKLSYDVDQKPLAAVQATHATALGNRKVTTSAMGLGNHFGWQPSRNKDLRIGNLSSLYAPVQRFVENASYVFQ